MYITKRISSVMDITTPSSVTPALHSFSMLCFRQTGEQDIETFRAQVHHLSVRLARCDQSRCNPVSHPNRLD